MVEPIEAIFPGLRSTVFQVTSPAARDYNCVAWAVGDTTRWWWPDPDADNDARFWPAGAPMEETVEAFAAAFQALGFTPCPDGTLEPGFEKIALFAHAGVPTHAARQLPSGRWTSKLGLREDIEHELHAVGGAVYGSAVLIFKRQRAEAAPI